MCHDIRKGNGIGIVGQLHLPYKLLSGGGAFQESKLQYNKNKLFNMMVRVMGQSKFRWATTWPLL